MSATLIIQIINGLVAAISALVPLFEEGKSVMSQTDAQAIKDALTKAQEATAALRPQVDAALDAAAQE